MNEHKRTTCSNLGPFWFVQTRKRYEYRFNKRLSSSRCFHFNPELDKREEQRSKPARGHAQDRARVRTGSGSGSRSGQGQGHAKDRVRVMLRTGSGSGSGQGQVQVQVRVRVRTGPGSRSGQGQVQGLIHPVWTGLFPVQPSSASKATTSMKCGTRWARTCSTPWRRTTV